MFAVPWLAETRDHGIITSIMSELDAHRQRVQRLHALADDVRLAVVDALATGDRSPGDLAAELGIAPNLLAYHLNVLEQASLVRRMRSEADRRRAYLQLAWEATAQILPQPPIRVAPRVVFVCTQNSARSQLAAAAWGAYSEVPVASCGTRPAPEVNPGARAAARRHGLRIGSARPAHSADVLTADDLVVSVCDSAHETLDEAGWDHLHWSVPDPVPVGSVEAFDRVTETVTTRVARLAANVNAPGPR